MELLGVGGFGWRSFWSRSFWSRPSTCHTWQVGALGEPFRGTWVWVLGRGEVNQLIKVGGLEGADSAL